MVAITKLGYYITITRFLTEATRSYSIFRYIKILIIKLGATAKLVVKPDNFILSIINNLYSGPRYKEVFSKIRARSALDIKSFLSYITSFTRLVYIEV